MAKSSRHGRSIMADMDKIQEEINKFYHRLETLEHALKYRPLTNDEREQTEKDVAEIRKVLKKQEGDLDGLRNENRSSALIAVLIIIISFLLFGLYHMYLNYKSEPSE